MPCKICEQRSDKLFTHRILGKYDIDYFQCPACGFSQTEPPYWLKEAYAESMNLGDTGQVVRNQRAQRFLVPLLYFLFDTDKPFLDFAGGHGLFTPMMRDIGLDYYWDDQYTENMFARGFARSLDSTRFELISAFEVFEHFDNPREQILSLLHHTDSVFFTTELVPVPAPREDWWYYGFDHGQHIAFHSWGSMRYLCETHGLHFHTRRGFHLLTRRRISPLAYRWVMDSTHYGLLDWTARSFRSKTISDHHLMSGINRSRKAAGD
ncbi:MAG: class I SAM-dependent methyltransferase [Planctomycetia bacterium]|nr:class I SAM-dependent methyltransferase [Planctomycetia bacterium]